MAPSLSLLSLMIFSLFVIHGSSADYSTLAFKGCADQNFQDANGVYRQTLKNLFDTLVSQSRSAKFYKTTSGVLNLKIFLSFTADIKRTSITGATAEPRHSKPATSNMKTTNKLQNIIPTGDGSSSTINGLFQCRGDLSNDDCNDCVKRTPNLARRLCGQAIAARIQLNGCYLRYEVSGFRQVSGYELLYKVCGSNRASGAGFGDRLNLALGEIVKGVGGGSGGFYAGSYESVYVLGQCEGDLSGGDCVNCVKNAIDRAKSECGASLSAQIYLQQCHISYTYYPNGVPSNQQPISPSGSGRSPQKTVAIVLGGLVGAGLVMACLLFTKSTFKKKHHGYKHGG